MFYLVLEKYCRDKLDYDIWLVLNIQQAVWCRYKKKDIIPLKHYKTICSSLGYHLCDNKHELSKVIFAKYYEVML